MTDSPRGRLVIRAPNWLGDAVMALPAMTAVRSTPDVSFLAVAAAPSLAPLFEEHTGVAPDRLVVAADPTSELKALREGGFDAALLFTNSFRSAWSARRAGIQERWGYCGNLRGWLLTRRVPRPRARVHQSEYYLNLVRTLGFDAVSRAPRILPRPGSVARADALLQQSGIRPDERIVGFAPGAAYGHAKRWPPARVADLVARLSRQEVASVLVGVAADRSAGREIESAVPAGTRVANLIGRTDLRTLVGILARCAVFVSNDSGAMHLAAAAGVPSVAIFGPTDERVTAPLGDHDILIHQVFCRPCMLRECPIDHRCMKGITVDAVFERVRHRLEART